VLGFLSVRFALAAVLAPYAACKVARRTLVAGAGIGLVLALGYLLQTTGLLFATPTNPGLITGLFVVFAPLVDRFFFGTRIPRPVLVAVLLSLLGIVLLAGGGPDGANQGDILTLLCAGALGLHLALLSRYGRERRLRACLRSDAFDGARLRAALAPLRARSFAAAGGLALTCRDGSGSVGRGVLGTDLSYASGSPRPAAVILTTEPVFAALAGYWLAGNRLVPVQIFGAALIRSGLIAGEVAPVVVHTSKPREKGDVSR
jgi:drug/metabolite transporter (DMT)-like permease